MVRSIPRDLDSNIKTGCLNSVLSVLYSIIALLLFCYMKCSLPSKVQSWLIPPFYALHILYISNSPCVLILYLSGSKCRISKSLKSFVRWDCHLYITIWCKNRFLDIFLVVKVLSRIMVFEPIKCLALFWSLGNFFLWRVWCITYTEFYIFNNSN